MKQFLLLGIVIAVSSCGSQPGTFERLSPESTGITFTNTIATNDSIHILNNEYLYNGAGSEWQI